MAQKQTEPKKLNNEKSESSMKPNINLPIETIANGQLYAKLLVELEKVFQNIADLNTPTGAHRKVQLTLTFTPKDDMRDRIDFGADLKTTLASVKGVTSVVLTEKKDGKVYANELKSGAQGQTYIDPDTGEVKTDTGKPIAEVEKEQAKNEPTAPNKVVDLQQKNQG